ncbi:MAG: D-alanyl-D-alanine carboxypeptidase [Dehalococcoidia bacterium]|nr:D-alanyl-D-alanine carboxypeptidase [Dehalococcoidia bacterium]
MKQIRLLGLILLIMTSVSMSGFGPPKLLESDRGKVPLYAGQLPPIKESAPPGLVWKSALIMDFGSGRVVHQRNERLRLPPASITKVMTAIVALEHADLREMVAIKKTHLVEGSYMGLKEGDALSIGDLLWGLLLPSGNDAATAIADQVGNGSTETFVAMMNRKAQELGLMDTHFVNPHGLHHPDHYSSAHDIAVMARYALQNPTFAEMVASRHKEISTGYGRSWSLWNSNQLLGQPTWVPGVDGVKTGLTEEAGDNIVASATRDGNRVIVVAMGTSARGPAGADLINHAFEAYTWVSPPTPLYASTASPDHLGGSMVKAAGLMVPAWQSRYVIPFVMARAGGNAPKDERVLVRYYLGDDRIAIAGGYLPKVVEATRRDIRAGALRPNSR